MYSLSLGDLLCWEQGSLGKVGEKGDGEMSIQTRDENLTFSMAVINRAYLSQIVFSHGDDDQRLEQ
jgi:hypothetical protein